MLKIYEAYLIRNERRKAVIYLGELCLIGVLEFIVGLGTLWGAPRVAVVFVLLSLLTLFTGTMASLYYDSVRPRAHRSTSVQDVLWAAAKLRFCTLLASGGAMVGITVLLFIADSLPRGLVVLVVLPALILLLLGWRVVVLARDYHRARARELESRE